MNHHAAYESLIARAIPRGRIPFTTSQNKREGHSHHHVIPRAFGGADDAENMVYLTYREHFIAHRLLAEIHGGKMSLAFVMMCNLERITSGRAYERHYITAMEARSADPVWIANNQAARDRLEADPVYRAARAKRFAATRATPQFRANMLASMKRRMATPGWQEKHRQFLNAVHSDPVIQAKVLAVVQARNADPEFQQRVQEKRRVTVNQPEFKKRMSAIHLEINANPEAKAKRMAAVAIARKTPEFKEAHAAGLERRKDNEGWMVSLHAMQQRKIKPVIGVSIATGKTIYLAGKQEVLATGFDNRGVSRCIAQPERNKSYKGYTWRLATLEEIDGHQ